MSQLICIIEYLKDFNSISVIVRLLLAVLCGGLVGLERSRSGRAAGLRTHILVCLGSAIASMTGLYISSIHGNGDVSRIAAQVISGIGFLGAGTILVKNRSTVVGLTTAACVWAVGTIGIAVGYGFYEAATFGSLLILFITKTLNVIDSKARKSMKEVAIYLEVIDAKKLNATLEFLKSKGSIVENVRPTAAKTNLQSGIGVELILHINKKENPNELIAKLNNADNIHFAVITDD